MEKQLVVGLGTGRCGTVSLSKTLALQKDSRFTHESKPLLPWIFSKKDILKKLEQVMSYDNHLVGDIAFYYLPYVEFILKKYPDTKFICLQRSKEETVKSYMKKTERKNHWMDHDGTKWKKDELWDPCFPKYETDSKEQAISMYWDTYYSLIGQLLEKYPANIKKYSLECTLNSKEGLSDLLSFVGIPKEKQILRSGIKENAILKMDG